MNAIIRRALLTVTLLASLALAKPELINEGVIKQQAADKINQISLELYQKTGVSIVSHFLVSREGGILAYEKNISSSLKSPYVLVVMFAKDQKIDITVSKDLETIIDKNHILNTFIIPILVAQDQNGVNAKYSAAMLNGIAEIADEIGEERGVVLESSIGSESRYFTQGIRAVFYGTIALAIGIYLYRRYKYRRES